MKKTYRAEQKQVVLNFYHSGTSVKKIVSETGIPRSTIYAWLKKGKETGEEHSISRKALQPVTGARPTSVGNADHPENLWLRTT